MSGGWLYVKRQRKGYMIISVSDGEMPIVGELEALNCSIVDFLDDKAYIVDVESPINLAS